MSHTLLATGPVIPSHPSLHVGKPRGHATDSLIEESKFANHGIRTSGGDARLSEGWKQHSGDLSLQTSPKISTMTKSQAKAWRRNVRKFKEAHFQKSQELMKDLKMQQALFHGISNQRIADVNEKGKKEPKRTHN